MSAITYGELYFGARKSQHPEQAKTRLDLLRELIPVSQLPDDAPLVYGDIRASLERSGTPIGANDLWIAAHAKASGLVLVSNNEREFSRVEGLIVENWVNP